MFASGGLSALGRQNAEPTSLDDYIGQSHWLVQRKPLRRMVGNRAIAILLFLWGPPGVGKNHVAQLLSIALRTIY